MTALMAYVEAHPWWTLIYLLIIGGIVSNVIEALARRR